MKIRYIILISLAVILLSGIVYSAGTSNATTNMDKAKAVSGKNETVMAQEYAKTIVWADVEPKMLSYLRTLQSCYYKESDITKCIDTTDAITKAMKDNGLIPK